MKVFKKEDALYWVILAIIILIFYFVFSDGQFSLIFTLAGTVQTFGFALIVLKINSSRSVTGLSRETFICYTLIFGIRAFLFLKYKVLVGVYRDIFRMIQLEILYFEYSRLEPHASLPLSFSAFFLNTKRAIIEILIL